MCVLTMHGDAPSEDQKNGRRMALHETGRGLIVPVVKFLSRPRGRVAYAFEEIGMMPSKTVHMLGGEARHGISPGTDHPIVGRP
jgi:hypothetical protein